VTFFSLLDYKKKISLKFIIFAFLVNKKLFRGFAIGSFLTSLIYLPFYRPLWEASFQVVIQKNSDNILLPSRPSQIDIQSLSPLSSLTGIDNSLETQVNILRSPSVLKPVFNSVLSAKRSLGQNIKKFYFEEWRDNFLDVELEKGTSVVSISYRDFDPELALKAAGLISSTYQDYSNKENIDSIDRAVDYLSSQVDLYRIQAKKSLENVESFRIKNNLGLSDGIFLGSTQISSQGNDSVEAQRILLKYKADSLSALIKGVKEAGSDVVYQAPQVNINQSLYRDLQELESELAFKTALLKDDDELIVRLKRRKASLISYMNTQTLGLLRGELISINSRLESFKRDPNVLINYRSLMAESLRDQETLATLEFNYQYSKLQQAKQLVPWELITAPTISSHPVSPSRLQMIIIITLLGNFLALIISLIKLNQSGVIVDFDDFNSLLSFKFLGTINENKSSDLGKILLPKYNLNSLKNEKRKLSFLPIGSVIQNSMNQFLEAFKISNQNLDITLVKSINELKISEDVILIVFSGKTTYEDVGYLISSVDIYNANLLGWIFVESNLI